MRNKLWKVGIALVFSCFFISGVNAHLYTTIKSDASNRMIVRKQTTYELVDGTSFNAKLEKIDNINKIKSIEFVDTIKPSVGVTEIQDLDADNDNGVVGWYTNEGKVYISSQKTGQKVIANEDASNMFNGMSSKYYLSNVELVDVELLDVSKTTNMNGLFKHIGRDVATNFSIKGLNNWDTSKVTNMNFTFYSVGKTAATFNIGDVSNWNVSNVETMYHMFSWTGISSAPFTLDLSGWDVSNVTLMSDMFWNTGANKIMLPKNISPSASIKNITTKIWYDETDGYKEYPAGIIPVGNAESHTLVDTYVQNEFIEDVPNSEIPNELETPLTELVPSEPIIEDNIIEDSTIEEPIVDESIVDESIIEEPIINDVVIEELPTTTNKEEDSEDTSIPSPISLN